MVDKKVEYVLVSQGCVVWCGKNKKRAEIIMKHNNDKYWDYYARCGEELEPSCDYRMELFEVTTHYLKIDYEYACDIIALKKRFEVRKNDRNFKVDDLIQFICFKEGVWCRHSINKKKFIIDYILPGGKFGIDANYVVLGIEEFKESDCII